MLNTADKQNLSSPVQKAIQFYSAPQIQKTTHVVRPSIRCVFWIFTILWLSSVALNTDFRPCTKLVFGSLITKLKNDIFNCVLYSFFTSPCLEKYWELLPWDLKNYGITQLSNHQKPPQTYIKFKFPQKWERVPVYSCQHLHRSQTQITTFKRIYSSAIVSCNATNWTKIR